MHLSSLVQMRNDVWGRAGFIPARRARPARQDGRDKPGPTCRSVSNSLLQGSVIRHLFGAVLIAAVEAAALPPPGAGEWVKPETTNGTVELTVQNGLFAIQYDLLPTVPVLHGNRTRFICDADILLKKPRALSPDTERICFESKGLIPDSREVHNAVVLQPIVRDANGELFYFVPGKGGNLNPSAKGWNAYSTAGFFAGEAGAAAQDMYATGGTPDNSRPDGKLELIGIRLHVTQAASAADAGRGKGPDKSVKGVLYLGEIEEKPFKVPFAHPFAYADAFLKEKGQYTFAAQVTDEFQGTPVREFRRTLAFDPADPASGRHELEFPLGPDGHYWIDYQVIAEDGSTVTSGFIKHQVLGNPDTVPLKPVALTEAPSIGYMRLNPGDPRKGVCASNEPYQVTVRIFPKGKKDVKLQYRLYPYYCKDVLSTGDQALTFPDAQPRDVVLAFEPQGAFTAFRLVLTLTEAGKTIDLRTYFFGRKTNPAEHRDKPGMRTDRREIKKIPYNRLTYCIADADNKPGALTFGELHRTFREYLANTHEFVPHHTYMVELNDFEILPGVYDFAVLDDVMDAAADYGCKVTVRFAHADKHSGPYRWGKFSRQISAEGAVIDMLSYGAYEVTDPALNKMWLDAYRAFYDRYNRHTAFEGYYIMLPAGEWIVVDQPWAGTIAGYSPIAAESFREYLQKTLKLSIADLNKRWGATYRSFDEVAPPLPTFRDGAKPDLRMSWMDFCRFKNGLGADFWIPKAVNGIRSYDDDRITIAYGRPSSYPDLYGKLDYGHNGGNHSLDHRGEYQAAWLKGGIGWITEPIHPLGWGAQNDPGKNGWVLDVSIWTMISQAGGGGANLHVYYSPVPTLDLLRHQGAFYALDRYEKFKPLLRELHQAELLPQTAEIAVHQDKGTLFTKHRTTFGARLGDLRRWFSLLEDDGIPHAELSAFPDASFKLVVPNILDEVISLQTFNRYVSMVKEGGSKMIIAANTGKHVPELGSDPFQLLKALGIAVPAAPYVVNGHVSAKTTRPNPLFPDNSSVDFQTVSTMREQLKSPDVIANFWQYSYRWIPETDYFGYYPGHQPGGIVFAQFADGGAAASLHQVGKGEVIVFWGTPDISGHKLKNMMTRAADWAKVVNPLKDAEVPNFTELANKTLKRHYGLFYLEWQFGSFRVKFPQCPDGDFFCDEMVSDRRIGRRSGKELREKGMILDWRQGDSPLKVVRMVPAGIVPPHVGRQLSGQVAGVPQGRQAVWAAGG